MQIGADARAGNRSTMITAKLVFIFTCACICSANDNTTYAITDDVLNGTNIDKRLIHKISNVLNNRRLDERDVQLLNITAVKLGIKEDVISRLTDIVNDKIKNNSRDDAVPAKVSESYNSYGDSEVGKSPRIWPIEESPAYASSVVLASDLLSLTRAVDNVEDKSCREQGYRFLDGLLMNRRSSLRSKYII